MNDSLSQQHLSRITQLELPICLICNRIRNRALLWLFSMVSWLGNGFFWAAAAAVLLALEGAGALPAIRHLLLAGAISFLLYKLLKKRTARPRPFASRSGFRLSVAPLDEFSFPSGHTLHAVAFTLVFAVHHPAVLWLVLPFTLLVAMSRVVLGLHYPSDVVAGAALGSVVALTVLQI